MRARAGGGGCGTADSWPASFLPFQAHPATVTLLRVLTFVDSARVPAAPRPRGAQITIYVEHPVPRNPPAEAPPPPPQPLKLTKKEQKKLRTQRRVAREKARAPPLRAPPSLSHSLTPAKPPSVGA